MKRILKTLSACLSVLVSVLAALEVWLAVSLTERATWSGEAAPAEWIAKAAAEDVFTVPGWEVAYWGRPDAVYSRYASRSRRTPVGVVVHHTMARPVKTMVTYGHVRDSNRGGAFGYHFYIGRDGSIVQGAPLTKRTNHIKVKTHAQRRDTAKHLWSGNTIGVTLVGGCDPLMRPDWRARQRCTEEFVSEVQLRAGLAVVRALQEKFGIACGDVYGHGDLQFDRESFEGERLSRLARRVCEIEIAAPEPVPAQLTLPGPAGRPQSPHVTAGGAATGAAPAQPASGS